MVLLCMEDWHSLTQLYIVCRVYNYYATTLSVMMFAYTQSNCGTQ